MIEPEQAADIEAGFAALLDKPVDVVRDYLNGRIRAAGAGRITGYRLVRGTHGGTYVRDPNGTDILPLGHEPPG